MAVQPLAPTYSFKEIKVLIPWVQEIEIRALKQTVQEEKERYHPAELRAIYKMMIMRVAFLVENSSK